MGKPLLSTLMTPSEAVVGLGAAMRRRLAVFWITLVVTALGVVAAPPAPPLAARRYAGGPADRRRGRAPRGRWRAVPALPTPPHRRL